MNVEQLKRNAEQYTQRAKDYLAEMTLEEKIALMSGDYGLLEAGFDMMVLGHYNRKPVTAGGNDWLKIPQLRFCDGPRGVVTGYSTCFPVAMQRGASFDVELEERVGDVIGKEVRAQGGNYFGGVCVNLLRFPQGGRAQETFGEDPWHVGQMGAAITRGVQKHNVIACVKHFALNNQENTRFKVDVQCDERVLREVYLPHFNEVLDAGAGSVMSSYNKYRGQHLGHNSYMLRKVLKEEWGFYGFVVSDFIFGIRDTVEAANGGLDIEMCNTNWYGKKLANAVRRGAVEESVIDEAALRIIRTLLMFTESPDPLSGYGKSLIACKTHIKLAREVAEKSMVLLKNADNTLPLEKDSIKRLAVIGKLAKHENIGDHGSSRVHPPYVISPFQGLQLYLGDDAKVSFSNGRNLAHTKKLASKADAVVLVVGYTHRDEGEFNSLGPIEFGGDRRDLRLHNSDVQLIQEIAALNEKTIVVLVGGSAIMMEEWKDSVPAILHSFYPGMEGGNALANILFGEVNPSGKLPFTIPTDIQHLPPFDRKAEQVEYDLYHGYTKLEKEGNMPAFAFGYGLSYTQFEISDAKFHVKDDRVIASAFVTNSGTRMGAEVVQFYVGFEHSKVDRPKKLLRGFKKVELDPGETAAVEIQCPIDSLRWYNPQTRNWELEGMLYQAYIGSSSRVEDLLEGSFHLSS
ncbi:MAG: glycoside hydrolase family 3 C-terminal domain-containing protein [Anaerolineaceae bacterium]|nr:glycoside hydrolase family 3 C-terminal domain-containing protein [Anaerolineaceae bacterium]